MKIYNTLSRSLEDFKPLKDEQVSLYTCGPTVYDYAQLGNLRSFIFDDTLRRTLKSLGYKVKHVMNITDVGHLVSDEDEGEDKLEKGAQREAKSVWEVARHYTEAYKQDAKKLNIWPPNGFQGGSDEFARATDFIDEQIEIIKLLFEKGFAYQTEQAIYFDTRKLPSYGRLTGQKLSDKEVAAREEVVTDTDKHHPQDFALWFFAVGRFKNHDMRWPSPWGEGFPGWHLECSAIIHATLGDPIDIHTGGVDHIGTHHTNEMAQTEAAFGHQLANYWMHNEFLLVDNQRMGKSRGNFYTLKDITDKGYDPLALRMLFLQSHYRSQANFTWEALDAAQTYLKHLQMWADSSKQSVLPEMDDEESERLIKQVMDDLASDLSTSKALAAINNFVEKKAPNESLLAQLDDLFGLNLAGRPDIDARQKKLLIERQAARQSEDWAKSDQQRDELSAQGIEISDTPNGQLWYRK